MKNLNSVLNRVAKTEIFVLNRVRVKTPGPHLPTLASADCSPQAYHIVASHETLMIATIASCDKSRIGFPLWSNIRLASGLAVSAAGCHQSIQYLFQIVWF